MRESIALEADDVTIERIDHPQCDDCGDGPETHRVMLDLRANGRLVEAFSGCEECAQLFAQSLAASLPEVAATGENSRE